MGKVGNVQLSHKNSGKTTFVQVNFYTKTKLFKVVDMPQEIKDWYGAKQTREQQNGSTLYTGEVTAKSYEEIEKLAKNLYDSFYDLEVNETKIIAYKIMCNLPEQKGDLSARRDLHFGLRHAFSVEYYVLYRFIIGNEPFISTGTYEQCKMPKHGNRFGGHKMSREDSTTGGYTDFTKIPYSEEMHEFFKGVELSLDTMIKNVIMFFGEDEKTLIENVKNHGIKLLK